MFNILGKQREEFFHLYEGHRMNVSATNVYFQNIRLLNTYKTEILTRDAFKEYYKTILDDIKNTSSPIDCLIPNDEKLINENSDDPNAEVEMPEGYKLFVINQEVPEYKAINDRIRADKIDEVFPADHPVRMAVLENASKLDQIIDEAFIHWLTFKYLETIETLHLQSFSNYTPVIEWVVRNITENDLKQYLISKNINEKKVRERTHQFIFKPDLNRMKRFYDEDHGEFKSFDVVDLIRRLTSNVVAKSDIFVVTALYLTLSFAMTDIYNGTFEESPCAAYVRDILSKI